MSSSLDWRGDEILRVTEEAAVAALREYGARWETAAKASVFPGRGVVTGTYRRSLHSAPPTYNFGGDDVKPSLQSPDRGGQGGDPTRQGNTVSIVVGSGIRYARRLEDMYNVVQGAHDQTAPLLPEILQRKAGLM